MTLSVSESWGILVRSSHRLAAKEFVKADDLKKEKLIVPENTSLRNDIREWIGPGLHIAAAYTLLRNAMILTEVSDWVTVCLETQKYVTKNLVFVPLRPERFSTASLIWRHASAYRPVMQEFLTFIGIQNMNNK